MTPPLVVAVDPAAPDLAALAEPARLLRTGGLVAFPTETVYGLGAHALDADAVARVFAAKGRPADNPLIVHVADVTEVPRVAAALTPLAATLAARFWPGPLTLVLPARPELPRAVTAGLDTVAVRVPRHPVALALLRAAAVPVAAPSANRSGRPSPTTAAHVLADLAARLDAVVDGGPCAVGLESTVVDARGPVPVVLREGAVTREALGVPDDTPHGELAASPGTRHAHYRPRCAVELADDAATHAAAAAARGVRVGLVARDPAPAGVAQIGVYGDADELGRRLYEWLRDAEAADVELLVVQTVPERGLGRAVMDRLRRAAGA